MAIFKLIMTLYRLRRFTALFVVIETVFKLQQKRNTRKAPRD